MLTLETPAKINLTLEVLRRRPDGYHEIRSVLQAVGLNDRLSFEEAEEMSYTCDTPAWQAEKSLVGRAVETIRLYSGSTRNAHIHITKRIPLSSGLGGDSSDCAAALRGLDRLWGLGIPLGDLVKLAAGLGSDVPFFLSGGTALVEGRGEFISPVPEIHCSWCVILFPPVERPKFKTGALYAMLQPEDFSDGARTDNMVARLTHGEKIRPGDIYNVFETVASAAFAGLEAYRRRFEKVAGEAVHLAGAGPALFALFDNGDDAARVHKTLADMGLESYAVETHNSLGIC